jgi:hypothetical protein
MVQPIGSVGVSSGMSISFAGADAMPAALGAGMPSVSVHRLDLQASLESSALGLEQLSAALLVALLLRDNDDEQQSAVRLLLAAALAMAMLGGSGRSTRCTSLEFAAQGMPLPAGVPATAYAAAGTPAAPVAIDAVA